MKSRTTAAKRTLRKSTSPEKCSNHWCGGRSNRCRMRFLWDSTSMQKPPMSQKWMNSSGQMKAHRTSSKAKDIASRKPTSLTGVIRILSITYQRIGPMICFPVHEAQEQDGSPIGSIPIQMHQRFQVEPMPMRRKRHLAST